MIDLEHVSKEYKRGGPLALDDINLHVDDGEFVFLLGHSGAGKSPLLTLLLREELPSEGKVTVLGKDVASLHRHQVPYLRRQMGIIFQDFRLIDNMNVYDNVAFAMRVVGASAKEIKKRVPYVLELVGLEGREKRLPQELSGGVEIKEGGDAEAIKSKMEEMSQKIYAIFGKLYQQAGGQPGADAGNGAGPQVNDDGTIDADAEVK